MAKYLDTNINPEDVTVDNIFTYDKQTTDVINQIQHVDMTKVSNGITGLSGYKQTSFSTRHLKNTIGNRPSTTVSGTVFFIKEE